VSRDDFLAKDGMTMAPIFAVETCTRSTIDAGPTAYSSLLEQFAQQSRNLDRLQRSTDILVAEVLLPKFGLPRWRRWAGLSLGKLWHYRSRRLRMPPPPPPIPTPAPTIGIVTPSFQQAEFLERTMRSVLDQKYPALEYVVQDGGSRDGSPAIIERYGSQLLHWESRPDRGQAHAVQLGFAQTTGEIMAYLNSDDVLLPGALAAVAAFFNRNPNVDAVYGHRVMIDAYDGEVGRWVMPPHDPEVLRHVDFVPQETLFWRRRIWDKVGGIDPRFHFALDWDLLLRFQSAGANIVRMDRFLGGFRLHRNQKTLLSLITVGESEMQELRLREHGRYLAHREVDKAIKLYRLRAAWHYNLYRVGLLERD
jgi:glycosyltransferase involved in cell wall biosynthesis